jgi:hypothetical protein
MSNMDGTPYSVLSVTSKPYMEVYQIHTPSGTDRFDLRYKEGGIFLPAVPASRNEHTQLVLMLLNSERVLPFVFDYTPSDDIHERLYNMIRSACDGLSVQITNVVEHPEDYSVVYYMRTSGSYSYIKVYLDKNGFVTYAKPMSMLGSEDEELSAVINEINDHFI